MDGQIWDVNSAKQFSFQRAGQVKKSLQRAFIAYTCQLRDLSQSQARVKQRSEVKEAARDLVGLAQKRRHQPLTGRAENWDDSIGYVQQGSPNPCRKMCNTNGEDTYFLQSHVKPHRAVK